MTARPNFPALLCLLSSALANAQTDLLNLPIGDPARSNDEVHVQLDTIVATPSGQVVSPQALVTQIGDSRLVLVGEEHTGQEFHAVQLRVLELLRSTDVPLMVGLEMFPIDRQAELDAWIAGELDEQVFLDTADWYRIWGYHWGYYREMFLFAREHAIPMFALRASDAQDDASAEEIPVAPPSDDHLALVQAFFETDSPVHGGLLDEQLDRLVAAQSIRDAAMASQVATALRAHPDRTLVVLAGTGHVLYELGIVRQLSEHDRSEAVSVIPVVVEDEETIVRASVGDFIWGIPSAPYPRYPELGVITIQADQGLHVIYIEGDSPAEVGGLETGDVLTALNGTPIAEKRDLSEILAHIAWGDELTITFSREGEDREINVALRRQ